MANERRDRRKQGDSGNPRSGSRRNFLKSGAAAGVGGAALAGLGSTAAQAAEPDESVEPRSRCRRDWRRRRGASRGDCGARRWRLCDAGRAALRYRRNRDHERRRHSHRWRQPAPEAEGHRGFARPGVRGLDPARPRQPGSTIESWFASSPTRTVATFEFLTDNGLDWEEDYSAGPGGFDGTETDPTARMADPQGARGSRSGRNGSGIVRALERSARQRAWRFSCRIGCRASSGKDASPAG